jgi:hypothetical protein
MRGPAKALTSAAAAPPRLLLGALLLLAAPLVSGDRAVAKTSGLLFEDLATEGTAYSASAVAGHASQSAGNIATSGQALGHSIGLGLAQQSKARMIGAGLGMGKDALKLLAACAICVIVYKLLSKIDCNNRKLDCRRFGPFARLLLWMGYDEFEGTEVLVQVHAVGDVQKDGMLGEKEFKVTLNFFWSKFETPKTTDMRWEAVKSMEIPQGASNCYVTLLSCGKFKDTTVATYELDTKKDILDKGEDFWGKKQRFKMEAKGKVVGELTVTFRKKGEGDNLVPISGVDDSPALAMAIVKWTEEDSDVVHSPYTCGNNCPSYHRKEEKQKIQGKLEGDEKMTVIAQVLDGPLRKVKESGKEDGLVYIKIMHCNLAELSGDDAKGVFKEQQKKAKEKGIAGVERKWYWCEYEDEKAAKKQWGDQKTAAKMDHPPDVFFPLFKISDVNRSPEREDQFIMKYRAEGEKETLIYRREKGLNREAWVEGVKIMCDLARDLIKNADREKEVADEEIQKLRGLHAQYLKHKGKPKNAEDWAAWTKYMQSQGYDNALITKVYNEVKKK